MLKQGSFVNRKYRLLLIVNILSWMAFCLNFLIDSIIGGNQLGETALSAVSIVSPLVFVINVVSYLFPTGFGILYGKYSGEFDKERSYQIAGEAILSGTILGLLIALALFLVKEPFLNFYNCSGELYENASEYYNWMIAYAFVAPIEVALNFLVVADSDVISIFFACCLNIGSNIILSYILCKKLGIAGLGIATVISLILFALGFCVHFLRKTNSIHFRLYFRWSDLKSAFRLSVSKSVTFLFLAVTDIVMNKVILMQCGQELIPAYAIINLAFTCFEVIGAVFESGEGMLATFMGERNNVGITNVMKISLRATLIMSVIMAVLFFLFSSSFPAVYGIETENVVAVSVQAARIMSFAALAYCISYLGIEFYAILDKPGLSMLVAFLLHLFCPLVISVPLAYIFGFTGISAGMMLSSYLVIGLFSLIVIGKYGKKGFPLYLIDYGEDVITIEIRVDRENIVLLRDRVMAELAQHGYSSEKIGLLMEELYTRIIEKNPGRKVISECTLLFGEEQVRIIVRDNGTIFNFIDEGNAVESLNAYVLNCLLNQTKEKTYVLTTSFNRNGFVFSKDQYGVDKKR